MTIVDKQKDQLLEAYDQYADALFRHCYFRVYDRECAKDLVQDTFVKTWEYLAGGKPIDNMRAFLYRVANNLVIDYVRRKKTIPLEDLTEQGFEPSSGEHTIWRTEAVIASEQVIRIMHALGEPYKSVAIMRFVDDMSPKEIAAILGETENAVSVRIHRAARRVRELWEQKGEYM